MQYNANQVIIKAKLVKCNTKTKNNPSIIKKNDHTEKCMPFKDLTIF